MLSGVKEKLSDCTAGRGSDRASLNEKQIFYHLEMRNRMLEVCLLGTGGMMPLPYRWLTSLMVRYNGKSILIDCGEGT